jgi:hypothetical protein
VPEREKALGSVMSALCSKFSSLTGCWRFGLGGKTGFNAVNGLLMDVPWMTVPLLFGGTGMLFVVLMLGSVLLVPLRALYVRGLPAEALTR